MVTEQALNKLHDICATFPKIHFSKKANERTLKQSCFAYHYVENNQVYVNFRLAMCDILRAVKELHHLPVDWHFQNGLWLTIPISDETDWPLVRFWIAKSYRHVAGPNAIVLLPPDFLKRENSSHH